MACDSFDGQNQNPRGSFPRPDSQAFIPIEIGLPILVLPFERGTPTPSLHHTLDILGKKANTKRDLTGSGTWTAAGEWNDTRDHSAFNAIDAHNLDSNPGNTATNFDLTHDAGVAPRTDPHLFTSSPQHHIPPSSVPPSMKAHL